MPVEGVAPLLPSAPVLFPSALAVEEPVRSEAAAKGPGRAPPMKVAPPKGPVTVPWKWSDAEWTGSATGASPKLD